VNKIYYKDGYCPLPAYFDGILGDFEADYYKVQDSTLIIRRGYAWDGASGPTWDTLEAKRASLVHDVLYQMISEGQLPLPAREQADQLFLDLLKEDGMSKIRRTLWWWQYASLAKGQHRKLTQ
jgi:hypothetical protein